MKNLKIETDFLSRKSGCAALDLAYVAAGRYDGYFQKTQFVGYRIRNVIGPGGRGIINDININNFKNLNIIASNSSINQEFKKNLPNF